MLLEIQLLSYYLSLDVRPPELKVPVNSSAASGPNVTLNCTDYGKHQCANNSSAEDETLQGGLPVNVGEYISLLEVLP